MHDGFIRTTLQFHPMLRTHRFTAVLLEELPRGAAPTAIGEFPSFLATFQEDTRIPGSRSHFFHRQTWKRQPKWALLWENSGFEEKGEEYSPLSSSGHRDRTKCLVS